MLREQAEVCKGHMGKWKLRENHLEETSEGLFCDRLQLIRVCPSNVLCGWADFFRETIGLGDCDPRVCMFHGDIE